MDQWLNKGKEATSMLERQFSLNDAIAIPGLMPFSSDSKASNNTDVELVFNSQKIVVKPNGDIELGVGSLSPLCTGAYRTYVNAVISLLQTFLTGLNPGTLTAQATAAQVAIAALVELNPTTTKVKAL
jgi:hypothetical protein